MAPEPDVAILMNVLGAAAPVARTLDIAKGRQLVSRTLGRSCAATTPF